MNKFFNIDAKLSNLLYDWKWMPEFDFAEPLADQLTDGNFNFTLRWGCGLFKIEILPESKGTDETDEIIFDSKNKILSMIDFEIKKYKSNQKDNACIVQPLAIEVLESLRKKIEKEDCI